MVRGSRRRRRPKETLGSGGDPTVWARVPLFGRVRALVSRRLRSRALPRAPTRAPSRVRGRLSTTDDRPQTTSRPSSSPSSRGPRPARRGRGAIPTASATVISADAVRRARRRTSRTLLATAPGVAVTSHGTARPARDRLGPRRRGRRREGAARRAAARHAPGVAWISRRSRATGSRASRSCAARRARTSAPGALGGAVNVVTRAPREAGMLGRGERRRLRHVRGRAPTRAFAGRARSTLFGAASGEITGGELRRTCSTPPRRRRAATRSSARMRVNNAARRAPARSRSSAGSAGALRLDALAAALRRPARAARLAVQPDARPTGRRTAAPSRWCGSRGAAARRHVAAALRVHGAARIASTRGSPTLGADADAPARRRARARGARRCSRTARACSPARAPRRRRGLRRAAALGGLARAAPSRLALADETCCRRRPAARRARRAGRARRRRRRASPRSSGAALALARGARAPRERRPHLPRARASRSCTSSRASSRRTPSCAPETGTGGDAALVYDGRARLLVRRRPRDALRDLITYEPASVRRFKPFNTGQALVGGLEAGGRDRAGATPARARALGRVHAGSRPSPARPRRRRSGTSCRAARATGSTRAPRSRRARSARTSRSTTSWRQFQDARNLDADPRRACSARGASFRSGRRPGLAPPRSSRTSPTTGRSRTASATPPRPDVMSRVRAGASAKERTPMTTPRPPRRRAPRGAPLTLTGCDEELVCAGGRDRLRRPLRVAPVRRGRTAARAARACGALEACSAGACGCAAGVATCGGACTDLARDPENCGACGDRVRAAAPLCATRTARSSCAASCPAGLTACAGACVDLGVGPVPLRRLRQRLRRRRDLPRRRVPRRDLRRVLRVRRRAPGRRRLAAGRRAARRAGQPQSRSRSSATSRSTRRTASRPASRCSRSARSSRRASPCSPADDVQDVLAHGGAVLVSNSGVGTLVVLDAAGGVLDEVALPGTQPNPHGLAVAGDTAYVALFGDGAEGDGALPRRARPSRGSDLVRALAALPRRGDGAAPPCALATATAASTLRERSRRSARAAGGSSARFPLARRSPSGTRVFVTLSTSPTRTAAAASSTAQARRQRPARRHRHRRERRGLDRRSRPGCGNPATSRSIGDTLWVACGSFGVPRPRARRARPGRASSRRLPPRRRAARDARRLRPREPRVLRRAPGTSTDQASGRGAPVRPGRSARRRAGRRSARRSSSPGPPTSRAPSEPPPLRAPSLARGLLPRARARAAAPPRADRSAPTGKGAAEGGAIGSGRARRAPPRRVVVLAPTLTDVVLALGLRGPARRRHAARRRARGRGRCRASAGSSIRTRRRSSALSPDLVLWVTDGGALAAGPAPRRALASPRAGRSRSSRFPS